MSQKGIDQLIINSPYEEPKEHWLYIRETQEFERCDVRRKSGYWRATGQARPGQEDPGEYKEIELANVN
jgi:type III restriction enzyme